MVNIYLETQLDFKNNFKIIFSHYNLLILKFQVEKFVFYEKTKSKTKNR